MSIDTKKLRELAEAATPVPECDDDCEHIECSYVVALEKHSAAWLTAANPQTVIALLDSLDVIKNQLGREIEDAAKLRAHIGKLLQEPFVPASQLAAMTASANRLKAQIDSQNQHTQALEQQLSAMTSARDEACDLLQRYGALLPNEKRRVDELRKVGQ